MVSSGRKQLAFFLIAIACEVFQCALENQQHSKTPTLDTDNLLKKVAETDQVLANQISEAIAAKDKEIAAKDKEVAEVIAAKDKEIADVNAAKDKEVADVNALLSDALQELDQAGIIPYDEELELKVKAVRKLTPKQ